MSKGTGTRITAGARGTMSALSLAVLFIGSCDASSPAASAEAVDHVAAVLVDAGRVPAGVGSAVHLECGPTDEFLGIALDPDPVHLEVAYGDVAPVVAELGDELPAPPEDGAPAHVDHHETSGDGWRVRWGESQTVQASDGAPGTTVTFVDGGEVDGDDLARWEQNGTVAEVHECG